MATSLGRSFFLAYTLACIPIYKKDFVGSRGLDPWPFPATATIGLFLDSGPVIKLGWLAKLGFDVLLTDPLVRLAISINMEMEGKEGFSR